MTQIRVSRTDFWGAVPEKIFEDSRLGLDARCVAGWLAIRPAGWEIRLEPMMSRLVMGRDRWRRIARELESAGYFRRVRSRGEGGRWVWGFEFDPVGGFADLNQESPKVEGNSTNPALSGLSEEEAVGLELKAARRAAARGERKKIEFEDRFAAAILKKIRAGKFQLSASAKEILAAREAEKDRQARLAEPPPGMKKKIEDER